MPRDRIGGVGPTCPAGGRLAHCPAGGRVRPSPVPLYVTGSVYVLALAGAAVLPPQRHWSPEERRGWSRLHLAAASVVTLCSLYILYTLYPAATSVGVPVPASAGALLHGLEHGFADLPAIGIPTSISSWTAGPPRRDHVAAASLRKARCWPSGAEVHWYRCLAAARPSSPASGLTASAPGTAAWATAVFVAASGVLVAVRNQFTGSR